MGESDEEDVLASTAVTDVTYLSTARPLELDFHSVSSDSAYSYDFRASAPGRFSRVASPDRGVWKVGDRIQVQRSNGEWVPGAVLQISDSGDPATSSVIVEYEVSGSLFHKEVPYLFEGLRKAPKYMKGDMVQVFVTGTWASAVVVESSIGYVKVMYGKGDVKTLPEDSSEIRKAPTAPVDEEGAGITEFKLGDQVEIVRSSGEWVSATVVEIRVDALTVEYIVGDVAYRKQLSVDAVTGFVPSVTMPRRPIPKPPSPKSAAAAAGFNLGDTVEILRSDGTWAAAKVVDFEEGSVIVEFSDARGTFRKTIPLDPSALIAGSTLRLAPLPPLVDEAKSFTPSGYVLGDVVEVMRSNGMWIDATVIAIDVTPSGELLTVEYYDESGSLFQKQISLDPLSPSLASTIRASSVRASKMAKYSVGQSVWILRSNGYWAPASVVSVTPETVVTQYIVDYKAFQKVLPIDSKEIRPSPSVTTGLYGSAVSR